MRITLNGETVETSAATVAELLADRGFGARVATALEGEFLPASLRATAQLTEGARLEVVAPMQGG